MNRRSVCWNITSKCNEQCKYCYRIITNTENTLAQNIEILKLLNRLSIKKISWTGGEAILYPNLIELLKLSKSNGIINNLLTNGKILTNEKLVELEPYLDYITFSYDSNNSNTNIILGRGNEHSKHIIALLNFIKQKDINIKVKINTLISKVNKNEIMDIGKTLENYHIERWKLFKFIPLRNYAIMNSNDFEISNKDFNDIVSNAKKIYSNVIKIEECNEDIIQNNYLLINSMGDFIITQNFEDKKIYNIRDNNIEILKKYLAEKN